MPGLTKSHEAPFPLQPDAATRAAGLARMTKFLPAAGGAYARDRNFDHGPQQRGNVSALSPYVRHRLITERELLEGVLSRHSLRAAEKFIQEVFWRGYFKGYLEAQPQIWCRYQQARDRWIDRLNTDEQLAQAYRRAVDGETGIVCFDFWSRELRETGYLHNHARMWFASIWIYTLNLPWELGADFTLRHFLDGDPASNTLSWRWVGGLHTKGKTYLARPGNIRDYTNGRFDAQGLAPEAPPLDEPEFEPTQATTWNHRTSERASLPSAAVLLLTEEDLHPESLRFGAAEIRAVAAAHAVPGRSSLPASEAVLRFTEAAIADGLSRASAHFNASAEHRTDLSGPTLITLARRHGVTQILTAYAPIGPVKDAFTILVPLLAREGIALVEIHRPEDLAIWQHANKGFFKVKERIPAILRELGVGPASAQGDLFSPAQTRRPAHR
jgi:deoxyribodipyrimidine photo-lyase